jgi:hypothetical protein
MGEEGEVPGDVGGGWGCYREVGRGERRKRMERGENGNVEGRHLAEQ